MDDGLLADCRLGRLPEPQLDWTATLPKTQVDIGDMLEATWHSREVNDALIAAFGTFAEESRALLEGFYEEPRWTIRLAVPIYENLLAELYGSAYRDYTMRLNWYRPKGNKIGWRRLNRMQRIVAWEAYQQRLGVRLN